MARKRKEIRNTRFKELLNDQFNGSMIAMADFLGLPADLISRYSKDKGIGEDIKDLIESKCKKNRDWLDGVEEPFYYYKNDDDLINILKQVVDLAGTDLTQRAKFKRILSLGIELSKPEKEDDGEK